MKAWALKSKKGKYWDAWNGEMGVLKNAFLFSSLQEAQQCQVSVCNSCWHLDEFSRPSQIVQVEIHEV